MGTTLSKILEHLIKQNVFVRNIWFFVYAKIRVSNNQTNNKNKTLDFKTLIPQLITYAISPPLFLSQAGGNFLVWVCSKHSIAPIPWRTSWDPPIPDTIWSLQCALTRQEGIMQSPGLHLLSYWCDKAHQKKQLKRERVFYGSQSRSIICHGRETQDSRSLKQLVTSCPQPGNREAWTLAYTTALSRLLYLCSWKSPPRPQLRKVFPYWLM